MFPHPKPPLGEPLAEAELAAFVRSVRALGYGRNRVLQQVQARFAPRGQRWHPTTIRRLLARVDEENRLAAWFTTADGRAELERLALALTNSTKHHSALDKVVDTAARLALIDQLARAARGQASPSELERLAQELAKTRRRPNQRGLT